MLRETLEEWASATNNIAMATALRCTTDEQLGLLNDTIQPVPPVITFDARENQLACVTCAPQDGSFEVPFYPWVTLDALNARFPLPKHHADDAAHPIMQVLAQAVAPWGLAAVYRNLQIGGAKIPFHAEEETAAALYFMLGHALRHGGLWRSTMVTELREYQARGWDAMLTAAGFRP